MKRKHIFSVATIGLLSLLLVAGAAVAAVFPEDNTFTGTVNQFEKGIKIGKQGTGGVTFFNGTIVNATTTDGADNPVTFGDNVRIDGRIQRGHNGAGDTWNVIVDDGLEVNKTLMVTGESTMKGKVKFEGGVEGLPTIDAYTKAQSDGKYENKGRSDKQIIYGHQFQVDSNCTFQRGGDGQISDGTCDEYTVAIEVPVGGKITSVDFYYLDDNAPNDVWTELYRSSVNALGTGTAVESAQDTVDSPSIYHKGFSNLSYTVNDTQKYWLHVSMGSGNAEQAIYGAVVSYTHP